MPGSQAPAFVTVEVEPERDSCSVAIEAFGVAVDLKPGTSVSRIAEVVSVAVRTLAECERPRAPNGATTTIAMA